jgi:hypothetical protein
VRNAAPNAGFTEGSLARLSPCDGDTAPFSARAERPSPFLVKQDEPEISWKPRDYLPAGNYPAFSRTAKTYFDRTFKRWQCVVNFDVLSDDLVTVIARLGWFLNLGCGEKPHAGHRSKFWCAWISANGGSPKRGDRMTPNVFHNRHALVRVRVVSRNFERVTSGELYSVIDSVLSWNTGGAL